MKKYFSQGLAILLPIMMTVMIVGFLINFLTQPFLESTKSLLEPFFHHSFLLFQQVTLLTLSSKILILLFLTGFIFLIGFLGKIFLINALFNLGDYFLHKLPFINKIYKSCQDVVHSIFSSCSSKKFSQVVFVPFPHPNNLSIGLITGESIQLEDSQDEPTRLVSVFVPGTPNPSVGFLLMFKREQLQFVNMKVDEAMKFVVSCGIVMPDFEILEHREDHEKPFFAQDHILSCERQFSESTAHLHKSPGSV